MTAWRFDPRAGDARSGAAEARRVDVKRFVVWWYRVLAAGFFLMFAIVFAGFVPSALTSGSPAAVGVTAVPTAGAVILAVRSLRIATVDVSDAEVVVHGLVRTQRLDVARLVDEVVAEVRRRMESCG